MFTDVAGCEVRAGKHHVHILRAEADLCGVRADRASVGAGGAVMANVSLLLVPPPVVTLTVPTVVVAAVGKMMNFAVRVVPAAFTLLTEEVTPAGALSWRQP